MENALATVSVLRSRIPEHLGWRRRAGEELPSVVGPIPRGAVTEIAGPPSSGRTALLYSLLAAVTARGEFGVVLDAGDAFDPVSAAAAGVRLGQVLWVRCGGSVENALKAADLLAQGGGFGLVAVDLGEATERDLRRIPLAAWFRLRRGVESTPTVLAVLSPRPQARSCALLKIELARRATEWRGRRPGTLLAGYTVAAECTRNHGLRRETFATRRPLGRGALETSDVCEPARPW